MGRPEELYRRDVYVDTYFSSKRLTEAYFTHSKSPHIFLSFLFVCQKKDKLFTLTLDFFFSLY